MRVLLFVLMIALMPLRGWVSDAMAARMAVAELAPPAHAPNATKMVAVPEVKTWASDTFHAGNANSTAHQHRQALVSDASAVHSDTDMPMAVSDCAGHAGQADQVAGDGDACGTCSACIACHLSAIQPGTTMLQTFSLPCPAPRLARHRFASADTALGQKPPIS